MQTHGSNTIDQILMTLNFLKCMGVDIKQKEFRLATEEKTSIVNGKVNKYTTVNLKMIESSESKTNVDTLIGEVATVTKDILPDDRGEVKIKGQGKSCAFFGVAVGTKP